MKDYKRLTDRDNDGIPYVKCADCYIRDKCDLTKEVCYQELQDRLAEIEDKIERGELAEVPKGSVVLTPEERAEEMRLCNEMRKQAVQEFADRVEIAFHYEFEGFIPSIMAKYFTES